MKCKYCQAELESNSSVCPQCGKDNLKDDLKVIKIVALSLVCVVMVVLLGGMISYGTTGQFIPDWLIVTEEEKFLAALDDVVVTMGEHKMTNRQLQLYFWLVAYNDPGKADLSKDLSTQVYDEATGQSYQDHFIEEAVKAWQEIMILSDAATAASYELPKDAADALANMKAELEYYVQMYSTYYGYDIETVDDLVEMQFGPGCDYQTYYDYSYHYYLGNLYWSDMVDALEVTDQQIEDFFNENEEMLKNDLEISITKDFGDMVDMRNILIPVGTKEVEDEEGNKTKVEDWEACLKSTQEILDEWLAGDKTAESFGALATEHSKDTASNKAGGLRTDLYRGCLRFVDVQHILVIPEGGVLNEDGRTYTYTDAEWAAALEEAEALYEQWKSGEMTSESFGALANEHSDDQDGKVTNGGLYSDVYMGRMVEAFDAWCFDNSRKSGDSGIVKTEFGYHIMYFVRADREVDDWCFDEVRVAGETAIVKTDLGYEILYFQDSEPAWYRYCRYGAQGKVGQDRLDTMREENPYTIDWKAAVIGSVVAEETK